MAFSIPQTIYPIYSLPPAGTAASSLNIGNTVKDMPLGSETEMKKTHDVSVIRIKDQFAADEQQYKTDFQSASLKASEASKVIDDARRKKIIAITLLVTSLVAIVGTALAMTVTGTLPLAFIAVPFLIAIVPTSYYTDVFRKLVAKLDFDIASPELLLKPVLNLPIYNQKDDLDLQQNRLEAQNSIALMSLKQLTNSNWTIHQITNYALLDRVTTMDSQKRPAFYAKTIQLINAYSQILKDHNNYVATADSEFRKMNRALKNWKEQQDSHISIQERTINELEQKQRQITNARYNGQHIPVFTRNLSTYISKLDLEQLKADTAENFGRRNSENKNWYRTTLTSIETAFTQALNNIESQYADAKSYAGAKIAVA